MRLGDATVIVSTNLDAEASEIQKVPGALSADPRQKSNSAIIPPADRDAVGKSLSPRFDACSVPELSWSDSSTPCTGERRRHRESARKADEHPLQKVILIPFGGSGRGEVLRSAAERFGSAGWWFPSQYIVGELVQGKRRNGSSSLFTWRTSNPNLTAMAEEAARPTTATQKPARAEGVGAPSLIHRFAVGTERQGAPPRPHRGGAPRPKPG